MPVDPARYARCYSRIQPLMEALYRSDEGLVKLAGFIPDLDLGFVDTIAGFLEPEYREGVRRIFQNAESVTEEFRQVYDKPDSMEWRGIMLRAASVREEVRRAIVEYPFRALAECVCGR